MAQIVNSGKPSRSAALVHVDIRKARMLIVLLTIAARNALSQENEPPQGEITYYDANRYGNQTKQEFTIIKAVLPKQSESEATREQAKEAEHANNELWIMRSTVFLALVTLGLAIFTALLWNAARKLVCDARDNSERQLRAYVSVEQTKIGPHP